MSFSIRPVAILCLIALAYVFCGTSCCWAHAEMRTWHAASGKFSIEAELADIRDDKVHLKKADGTTTWVELQKLSLADIKFEQESLDKARQALRKKLDGGTDVDAEKKGSPTPSTAMPTEGKVEEENTERLPGWDVDVESGNLRSPFSGMREVVNKRTACLFHEDRSLNGSTCSERPFQHDVDLCHLLVVVGTAVRVDVREMHGGQGVPILLEGAACLAAGTRSRRDFIELSDSEARS